MPPTKANPLQKPQLSTKILDGDKSITAHHIVEAFARRANVTGIRSISMSDLAKELRISTKTLYKSFRTKEAIVYELVVKWEKRVHKPISYYGDDLLEILSIWIKIWVENDAQFSTAFWSDLKSDYPQLYKVYVDSLAHRMKTMKKRVAPYLKDVINKEFAWSAYFTLLASSSQPKTFEKLGMTREQCVFEAFDFWVEAAIDKEKIKNAKASD